MAHVMPPGLLPASLGLWWHCSQANCVSCGVREGPVLAQPGRPHHLHRLAEVTVSKDDEGRLPAQLQGHLLQVTQRTAGRREVAGAGTLGHRAPGAEGSPTHALLDTVSRG